MSFFYQDVKCRDMTLVLNNVLEFGVLLFKAYNWEAKMTSDFLAFRM